MKNYKKVLIGISALFLIMSGIIFYVFLQQGKDMEQLKYSVIDMNSIQDGVYDGEANTTLIKAKIQVELVNHTIQSITILKHDNGIGSQAEKIIVNMKESNTYDVDTISGATLSSQVIKSAVNQAIAKGTTL